jgi:hypothetical protein
MKVLARRGMARLLLGSGRTPAWDQADKDYHATHKTCEMCGTPVGSLGGFDGASNDQMMLEAHDVQPYHTLTDAQKNDYNFILSNLIMLHRFEHHRYAHRCDPKCGKFDPRIRELAAVVLKEVTETAVLS